MQCVHPPPASKLTRRLSRQIRPTKRVGCNFSVRFGSPKGQSRRRHEDPMTFVAATQSFLGTLLIIDVDNRTDPLTYITVGVAHRRSVAPYISIRTITLSGAAF